MKERKKSICREKMWISQSMNCLDFISSEIVNLLFKL